MDRRMFLTGALALPTVMALGGGPAVTDTTINAATIDGINADTLALRLAQAMTGGGTEYRRAVDGVTALVKQRLHSSCPLGLEADHLTAIGWRASTVGFQAFDVGLTTDAEHWWRIAENMAREALNWSLTARVLGQRARMYTYQGDTSKALPLLDEAIARGEQARLTGTEMAMLHALRARALATAGLRVPAITSAKMADGLMFGEALPGDVDGRPWIAHYDQGHHYGDIATAYATLARNGARVVGDATGAFINSVTCYGVVPSRSAVLSLTGLARIEVEAGDLEGGVIAGHRGLDLARPMLSARVADNLRLLAASLSQHGTHPQAVELAQEIATLVPARS